MNITSAYMPIQNTSNLNSTGTLGIVNTIIKNKRDKKKKKQPNLIICLFLYVA